MTAALSTLVYVSTAARFITPAEIQQLLVGARANNHRHDVTGALLYIDGQFMQCLEGPETGIRHVVSRIKISTRHYGRVNLLFEPLPIRNFGDWTMAFSSPATFGVSQSVDEYALIDRLAPTAAEPLSTARRLLLNFWNNGEGLRQVVS